MMSCRVVIGLLIFLFYCPAMSKLIVGRSSILALIAAAVVLAVVAWLALVSGSVEPAETGQDRIEVVSPGDVATLEGDLRRLW